MFGNNFNKAPSNKIAPIKALERVPSKEELLNQKLEKLGINLDELNSAIENAGGAEKVEQYLKEHGQDDLHNSESETSKYKILGVLAAMSGSVSLALGLTSASEGYEGGDITGLIVVGAIVSVAGVISFMKARMKDREFLTNKAIMEHLNVEHKTLTEIDQERYEEHLAALETKKKAKETKDETV
jgi:hypothetical protein